MAAVTSCENDLLSRTHRDGNDIFTSEDWNSVHQTLSANRAGAMFSVCERLGLPRAVQFFLRPLQDGCHLLLTTGNYHQHMI